MKRSQFIKHLEQNGCFLLREGANHTIYKNSKNGYQTAVPRHSELKNIVCKEICKQLDIPKPF
jgi:predicted RNA binding protein YcfA (HicA-like mRNA interferase family)